MRSFLLLTLVAALSACSISSTSENGELFTRLDGRGVVPVMVGNRYLASTALLDAESLRSDELKGFLSQRGQPDAIEVVHGSFPRSLFTATKIDLLYQLDGEKFEAEKTSSGYIITGPFKIDRSAPATLAVNPEPPTKARITTSPSIAPTKTSSSLFNDPATSAAPVEKIGAVAVEPKLPDDKKNRGFQSPELPTAAVIPVTPATPPTKTANAAVVTIIDSYGKETAELTPKGDLVHYVTLDKETFELLALWYTLDQKNGEILSRINRMKKLSPGDSVIVPKYMLKNVQRLPEAALSELQNELR